MSRMCILYHIIVRRQPMDGSLWIRVYDCVCRVNFFCLSRIYTYCTLYIWCVFVCLCVRKHILRMKSKLMKLVSYIKEKEKRARERGKTRWYSWNKSGTSEPVRFLLFALNFYISLRNFQFTSPSQLVLHYSTTVLTNTHATHTMSTPPIFFV